MNDLVTFLRARLDEREARALAVEDNSAPWDGQWKVDGNHALRTYNDHVLAYLPDARPFKPGVLAHIADNDPAFVLADVTAKRQIIALVLDEDNGVIAADRSIECEWGCTSDLHEQLLHLLALPFAGHPDYDESWRP